MMKVTRWNSRVPSRTLAYYKKPFLSSFATKELGYLAALYLLLPLLAGYKLSCYQITCYRQFQCLQKIPCWKPLVISFCSSLGSTLLLIERTTIDPLYLRIIRRWWVGWDSSCNQVPELYIIKISLESRAWLSCYDLEGIKEKRKNKKK